MESTLELPEIFFFSDFFDLVDVVVDDVEDSSLTDGIGLTGSEDGAAKCSFAAVAAGPDIGC